MGELLGSGAMASVYHAVDRRTDISVAIKLLHPTLADDQSFLERFEREAHLGALLRSPYTAQLLDYGSYGGRYFIAMEYVDGRTLRALIDDGPIEVRRALRIAVQVARALEEAEARGVVHRDIKPDNIMVKAGDSVKVLDFGIARQLAGGTLTVPGGFLGTLYYAAPEQAMGRADSRSDIYALGATLYHMLSGHPPFTGDIVQLLTQHREAPVPLEELGDVPDRLKEVMQSAMEKDPDKRYQTASAMAAALERAGRLTSVPEAEAHTEVVASAALESAAEPTVVQASPVGPQAPTEPVEPPTIIAAATPVPATPTAAEGEAPTQVSGSPTCLSCGLTLGTDEPFCPRCGTDRRGAPLAAAAAAAAAAGAATESPTEVAQPASAPAVETTAPTPDVFGAAPPPAAPTPAPPPPPVVIPEAAGERGGIPPVLLVIGGLAVIGGIAAAAFLLLGGGDEEEEPQVTGSTSTAEATEQAAGPVANDNFDDGEVIAELPFSDSRDVSEATAASDDPANNCTSALDQTVWYAYEATGDDTLFVDTTGSSYDTVAVVYSGSDSGDLSEVACDDDAAADPLRSLLSFDASEGETYHIMIGNLEDEAGEAALELLVTDEDPGTGDIVDGGTAASNDDFENATTVSSLPFTDTVDITNTTGGTDPVHACSFGGSYPDSIWYRYDAPVDESLVVDTAGSDYDTVAAVFAGSDLNSLAEVGCNDDFVGSAQAAVSFPAFAGETYFVLIARYSDEPTEVEPGEPATLQLSISSGANNDRLYATPITLFPFEHNTDSSAATTAPDDPVSGCGVGQNSASVWYSVTAPSAGTLATDTQFSDYDTVLAVWLVNADGGLTEVGCNDDFAEGDPTSNVSVSLTAGSTYLIEVTAHDTGAGGLLTLLVDFP
jgi:eukaryotic-like serine/threonine-protein kinase